MYHLNENKYTYLIYVLYPFIYIAEKGFPGGTVVKNLPANAGDEREVSSVPGWGKCPGGAHTPLPQWPRPLSLSLLRHRLHTWPSLTDHLAARRSAAGLGTRERSRVAFLASQGQDPPGPFPLLSILTHHTWGWAHREALETMAQRMRGQGGLACCLHWAAPTLQRLQPGPMAGPESLGTVAPESPPGLLCTSLFSGYF